MTEYPSGVATDSLQAIGSIVDMPDAIRLRAITTFFNAATATLAVEGAGGFGMRINIEDPNALGSPHLRVQTGGSDVFEVNGYGSIQLGDGTSDAGLSDAGTAKLRYNGTALQVSLNGGAYADVSTGGGSGGLLVAAAGGARNIGTTSLGSTLSGVGTGDDDNIAIGNNTLSTLVSGDGNVVTGNNACSTSNWMVISDSTVYGKDAGLGFGQPGGGSLNTGQSRCAMFGGSTSCREDSSIIGDVVFGFGAGPATTGLGSPVVCVGYRSGEGISGAGASGQGNTLVGPLTNVTGAGQYNSIYGYSAQHGAGDRNTVLGDNAGRTTSTGNENILIGSGVASSTDVDGDNNILIGADLEVSGASDTFRLRISPNPTHVATPLIDGNDTTTVASRTLQLNANVTVGGSFELPNEQSDTVTNGEQVAINDDTVFLKVTSSGVVAMQGMTGNLTPGRTVIIYNEGSNNINLSHDSDSGGSTTARFFCPGGSSYTLTERTSVMCWYSDADSRWLVLGAP